MNALNEVCIELAQAIVRDGEGATKFITLEVIAARDETEASRVGKTVANSPLVKTAFFASDPNWGRILAAIGRAGVEALDIDAVNIYLGDVCIVSAGGRAPDYVEQAAKQVMDRDDITVRIDLGRGEASATVWTCDFSYDYVKINAEYRS
jgi:glutamate N-acetyltransferase/amino-acid N-acetyltransferase